MQSNSAFGLPPALVSRYQPGKGIPRSEFRAAQQAWWAVNPPHCDDCGHQFKTNRALWPLRRSLGSRVQDVPKGCDEEINRILCNRCMEAALQRTCQQCGKSFQVVASWRTCIDCLSRDRRNEPERLRKVLGEARRKGLPATLTLEEWLDTLAYFDGRCAFCREMPSQSIEHFLPVALGGGTTVDNCVPACLQCNTHKGTKTPEECIRYRVCSVATLNYIRTYLWWVGSINR